MIFLLYIFWYIRLADGWWLLYTVETCNWYWTCYNRSVSTDCVLIINHRRYMVTSINHAVPLNLLLLPHPFPP